jgi:SRSO17 transposase
MAQIIETVIENKLTVDDIEPLTEELERYQAIYDEYFNRKEQKREARGYLAGLMQPLPNKSIERIVLHNQGDDANAIRAMQHFMSQGAWQDKPILKRHWQEVDQEIGSEDGVVIADGSGFPKQGQDSVGVKRQWCGQLGKVDNCQVGVFLGYASQQGYTLLDRRLYLPQEWVTDEAYADRREKCGIPEDISFKTKPELVLDMIKEISHSGQLRFRWLTCDEEFGRDPAFLDEVGQYLLYLAEIPANISGWLERPKTSIPKWSGRGRKPNRERLVAGETAAQSVVSLAAAIPAKDWSRQTIKEGTKGPLVADFAAIRVISVRDGLPGHELWLVCRRDVFTQETKYYFSNAPANTPLTTLVWLTGMRWPIETCFEDGKQELGLGDYQLRGWLGWHHHMTLVILAHFFLVRIQRKMKPNVPNLTLPQAILLLKAVLPQPKVDLETTVDIINYYQRRHASAHRSHRKRRLHKFNQLE